MSLRMSTPDLALGCNTPCKPCLQDFPDANEETEQTAYRVSGGTILTRQEFSKKGNVFHVCGCSNTDYDNSMSDYQTFRTMSDRYLNYGRYPNRRGWSNAVWSFGALPVLIVHFPPIIWTRLMLQLMSAQARTSATAR